MASASGNPDRARRSGVAQPIQLPPPGSMGVGTQEDDPSPPTVGTAQAPSRPTAKNLSTPTTILGEGGTLQTGVAGCVKRSAVPIRTGPVWNSVQIVANVHTPNPHVICKNCGHKFAGGASKITDHILAVGSTVAPCKGTSEEYFQLKKSCQEHKAEAGAKKAKLANAKEQQVLSEQKMVAKGKGGIELRDGSIQSAFSRVTSSEMDEAIARLIYAENLSFRLVESPHFAKVINLARTTNCSYKLPHRRRLSGDLLDITTTQLKAESAPLRDALVKFGCTLLCDGWDDLQQNHLINCIVATSKGNFFYGTTMLDSDTNETGESVYHFLKDSIEKIGPHLVMHVCTDTCATMKKAWRLLEAHLPWISCTCCAAHVLSLELKDLAKKIDIVAVTISKMQLILRRFWGKTRWPRTKLKEIARNNHGKAIGLYRAKETRFAGKYLELARAMKLKGDLQQVVVSSQYTEKRYGSSSQDRDYDDDTDVVRTTTDDNVDDVKAIILDDQGFWKDVTDIISVASPIVKVLRMTDNTDSQTLGKIYKRMFDVTQFLHASDISWAPLALEVHEDRWEYLHGVMHAAAYALDPEYLWAEGDKDQATQEGFLTVVERLSLWLEIRSATCIEGAMRQLTTSSPAVVQRSSRAMKQYAQVCRREGILSKPLVIQSARDMVPSTWWSTFCSHLPDIKAIAVAVLEQPSSAAAAERNWSVYGSIKSDKRARMRHEVADKRVFCHETLHYANKLQHPLHVQSIEAWSDSESSIDEEDLFS